MTRNRVNKHTSSHPSNTQVSQVKYKSIFAQKCFHILHFSLIVGGFTSLQFTVIIFFATSKRILSIYLRYIGTNKNSIYIQNNIYFLFNILFIAYFVVVLCASGPGSSPIQTGMSDEDSRASTSSSSSPPSSSQTRQRDTLCKKKRESKASMSKTSKLLSTSAKR